MTNGPHDSIDGADGELLYRFAQGRDQEAFAALVRRHGRAVLAVCRRVLRDPNDAEDAFQATFLILARKAGSLARPDALAGWLYGVAFRTALEAKTQARRRRARESLAVPASAGEPTPEADWADLRPVLDEEVSRLPEKYRAAFVLCHVEGRTNEEAACLLGCPKGTVLSRLAWARERLRWRLSRRGLAPTAGLLACLVCTAEASAVPSALFVGAASSAAAAPAKVVALTEGVLRAMWLTKLKTFAFVLVAAVAVGTGGSVTYHALGAEGKTDKEKLEGKWVIASAERGGKKVGADDEGVKGLTITIKGDKATLSLGGRTQEATVALDSGKTPKQIDLTVNEGGKDEVHLGIYKLDGDTFTLCKSHPPGERPTKFASVEGQKWPAVFVLKREKK